MGETYNVLERVMRKLRAICLALFLAVMGGIAHEAQAVETLCPTPTANGCKPCAIFTQLISLINSDLVGGSLDPGVKAFVLLLSGDVADIDGSFVIDDSGEDLIATLTGDDMRDVSAQLQMVDLIIRDNTGRFGDDAPISTTELRAAFAANLNKLNEKIGPGSTLDLLQLLLKPVIPALTYFTLLGKSDDFANIVSVDPINTNGKGTLGVLQALLKLLSGVELNEQPLGFADTDIRPGDFITFGDLLGPNADLDGDGFSNLCEYRHFKKPLCATNFANPAPNDDASRDYIAAALDPSITPVGCYEVEDPELDDCSHPLTTTAVVPPGPTGPQGNIRYRRFENTVTGAERYQINYLNTLESAAPSAKVMKGLPGQVGTETIFTIPVATPTFWEIYVGPVNAAKMKATSNYFEVTGVSSDDVPVTYTIRGDNTCGVLAPPPPVAHAADTNKNFIIEETEILAVIEYINAGDLSCNPTGGFLAGAGDQTCTPHDSDYNPQNWKISLPELLRLVQLYTAGAYEECIGGSEDGYCITVN